MTYCCQFLIFSYTCCICYIRPPALRCSSHAAPSSYQLFGRAGARERKDVGEKRKWGKRKAKERKKEGEKERKGERKKERKKERRKERKRKRCGNGDLFMKNSCQVVEKWSKPLTPFPPFREKKTRKTFSNKRKTRSSLFPRSTAYWTGPHTEHDIFQG